VWYNAVSEVLSYVAGRKVDIHDAFRLGIIVTNASCTSVSMPSMGQKADSQQLS